LNAAVLKTVKGASPSGVRIPLSPPICTFVKSLVYCLGMVLSRNFEGIFKIQRQRAVGNARATTRNSLEIRYHHSIKRKRFLYYNLYVKILNNKIGESLKKPRDKRCFYFEEVLYLLNYCLIPL
jgi:hypothetical protein